jgi:hypothetical protein
MVTEMHMNGVWIAALLSGMLLAGPARGAFPEHCDAVLVLSNATWWAGRQADPRNVQLRMQRLGRRWDPVVVGHTLRGQNATHYGFITDSSTA